jgi:hypothetical protein
VTPTVDSSAIHPLHNQPCSTSSHHRCWPPAGHAAASPPRLPTTLTGAPFRSTTGTHLPFRNRSLRPASRHNFSARTILSAPHPSKHAVRPHSFQSLTSLHPNFLSHCLCSLPTSSFAKHPSTSWTRFVPLLPIAFNPLAVSGQSVSSCFLPKLCPLSHPPELPLLTCGWLAICHPPDTSPPDQSDISILSVVPATYDARARRRHFSTCPLPHHIQFLSKAFFFCGVDLSGRCTLIARRKHVLRHSDLLLFRVSCHHFTRLLAAHHCAKLLLDNFPAWDHAGGTWVALLVWR